MFVYETKRSESSWQLIQSRKSYEMEKSNRHRLSNGNKIRTTVKPSQEQNRPTNRERDMGYKNRINKHPRRLHEFIGHQISTETMSEFHSNYLPVQGQRLFAAVSDPAVCGYPVSHCYPLEPVPLSVGFPVYQAAHPYQHRMAYKELVSPARRPRARTSKDEACHSNRPTDEYASLPPGNISDFESDHQRRFSDPGLANAADSDETDSCNDSATSWDNISNVADQIENLMQENKRLSKELQETKVELQNLKQEMNNWTKTHSSYDPGFISELVREVRDATKVREEALLARVKNMMDSGQSSLNTPEKKVCSQECEDLKDQLKQACSDKDTLNDRLLRLEEQMKTMMIHNSVQETSRGELLEVEKEKLQLRRELQEAVDARKAAEANITKLERLVNTFRKKLPNGLVLDEKPITAIINPRSMSVGEETPSESISSSLGSGSIHSPHVTMSGPVTDL